MPDNPGNSPADQLAQLKQDLEANQAKTADLSKEADRLKAQITDLGKSVVEIDGKSAAWDKASAEAGHQQQELTAYIKTKKQMLEATVGNKAAVVKAKDDAQQALADQAKQVQALSDQAAQKETALATAKADTVAKQAAYTSAGNLANANDASLKDLTALRASVEKEIGANNVSRPYFLTLLMEDVIQNIKLPTSADYTKALDQAAVDLAAAKVAERTASEALDAAVVSRQEAQKKLDDAKSKWRQQTLDSIVEQKAAAAPAAGGPPQ